MRNLGSGQPLVTDLATWQVLDSVTFVRGRHAFKAGASATFRSREVLNADNIPGFFVFNQNLTSNCAGQAAGCVLNPTTGFDVASFLLGYASDRRPEPDRRGALHGDAARMGGLRPGRLPRRPRGSPSTSACAGTCWSPWVEEDDRQSNFDPSTGRFVVASDDAVIDGVRSVGTSRPTRRRTSDRGSASPTTPRATAGRSCAAGSACSGTAGPGGTSSSKAQNPPFLRVHPQTTELRDQPQALRGIRRPAAGGPDRAAVREHPLGLRGRRPRLLRAELEPQPSAAARPRLPRGDRATSARGADSSCVKTDQNQAPPSVGVTDPT